MSQTLTLTNPIKGVAFLRNVGLIPVTVALSSETYSSGVVVDFATILAAASYAGVSFTDVVAAFGFSSTGHVVVATKGTTAAQFTLRGYTSGGSEVSSPLSATFYMYLLVAGGSE